MSTTFTDIDILLGKGTRSNLHPGNKAFRNEVKLHHELYDKTQDGKKCLVAQGIVHKFLASGARFLRKDEATDMWVEVDIKTAYKKTQQTLRDGRVKRREDRVALESLKKTEGPAPFSARPTNVTSSLFQLDPGEKKSLFKFSAPAVSLCASNNPSSLSKFDSSAKSTLFDRREGASSALFSCTSGSQRVPPPPQPLQRQNSLDNCLAFSSISSATEISPAIFDSVAACHVAPRPKPVLLPDSMARATPLTDAPASPTSVIRSVANARSVADNKTTTMSYLESDEILRERLWCFSGDFGEGRHVSI